MASAITEGEAQLLTTCKSLILDLITESAGESFIIHSLLTFQVLKVKSRNIIVQKLYYTILSLCRWLRAT